MRKYINIILLASLVSISSCEKFLEPNNENNLSEEQMLSNAGYVEGILLKAYVTLPLEYDFAADVASDDAVTNDLSSTFRRMAIGEWKSTYNPLSEWNTASQQIYYLNKFLSVYKKAVFATDPRYTAADNAYRDSLYKARLKGEAFGLRAYYKFRLLQNHAGMADNGDLLGFPIINKPLSLSDEWRIPRNTFAECIKSIMDDCDSAIYALPPKFVNKTEVTRKDGFWNLCMGKIFDNRISENAVIALKSRAALLAASPAFSASSGVPWDTAAVIAGRLLRTMGTLYYRVQTNPRDTFSNINFYREVSYTDANNEIIWNRAKVTKKTWEQNNLPPSQYGSGFTNPSQSLVDAFPMRVGGWPITDPLSGYRADNPYSGRDRRFKQYIIYNTSILKGTTKIHTYKGAIQDGIGSLTTSTRTGYYLKKFMLETVSLNPSSPADAPHMYTLFRTTEVLLNFCEAANEAWGPDDNRLGFSVRSKLAELRSNAGISPDNYLASLTTKEQFRELIRNERRISLCFEGFRFWDIRRWNDVETMRAPVTGMFITQVDGVDTTYEIKKVEDRIFSDDMIYGPVPYEETLKYNLIQNKGW